MGANLPVPSAAGLLLKSTGTAASDYAWGDLVDQVILLTPSGDSTGATDTTAVNDAVTTLLGKTAPGGRIVLGGGQRYTTGLTVDFTAGGTIANGAGRLKIQGAGAATQINNVGTAYTDHTFTITGANSQGSPADHIWLEVADLHLEGSATCGSGFYISNLFEATFRNLTVLNFTNISGTNGIGGCGFQQSNSGGSGNVLTSLVFDNNVVMYNNTGYSFGETVNACTWLGGWIAYNAVNSNSLGVYAHATNSGANTFVGTIIESNSNGFNVDGGRFFGCWIEANTGNAGTVYSGSFEGCYFSIETSQSQGALQVDGGPVTLSNCRFFAGGPYVQLLNAATVLISGSNGLTLSGITSTAYNGAGVQLVNNAGLNPVGVVPVAVPASGTAVAADMYDRTLYITTGDAAAPSPSRTARR